MADPKTAAQSPAAGDPNPAPAASGVPDAPGQTNQMTPLPGAVDAQRVREQAYFDRKLAADDAARAKAGSVTLVATASFTMVDDPDVPEGRIVQAGQEFRISAHDLQRFEGRGVPKALDATKPGVSVQQDPE